MTMKFAAVALAISFLAGLAPYATAADSTAAQKAVNLYRSKCATCHGQDGAGSQLGKRIHVSDLRSDLQNRPDSELTQAIADGRNNMPSFKSTLSKTEIDALVRYVRGLAGTK